MNSRGACEWVKMKKFSWYEEGDGGQSGPS